MDKLESKSNRARQREYQTDHVNSVAISTLGSRALPSREKGRGEEMERPEEVIGTVIGPITVCGRLYYDGREQGPMLYAETEFELARVAEMAVKNLRAKHTRCYPETGAWELREVT